MTATLLGALLLAVDSHADQPAATPANRYRAYRDGETVLCIPVAPALYDALRARTDSIVEASKVLITDPAMPSGTFIYTAGPFYRAAGLFARDFLFFLEGSRPGRDRITADEVKRAVDFMALKQLTENRKVGAFTYPKGSVPDHIYPDGRWCWGPGLFYGDDSAHFHRPSMDEAMCFVILAWHYGYRAGWDSAWQTWFEEKAQRFTDAWNSVPRNPRTGLVTQWSTPGHIGANGIKETNGSSVMWGFHDSYGFGGDDLGTSVLACDAARALADMHEHAGDAGATETWARIADAMRDSIRAQFNPKGYLPWGVGRNAPTMASPDCTGYAVWSGILTDAQADAASDWFAERYRADKAAGGAADLFNMSAPFRGAVRMARKADDVSPGRHVWPDMRDGNNWENLAFGYNAYQDGGYWYYKSLGVAVALNRRHPDLAREWVGDAYADLAGAGAEYPYERIDGLKPVNGRYNASVGQVMGMGAPAQGGAAVAGANSQGLSPIGSRSLDGRWTVVADRDDAGLKQDWWLPANYGRQKAVPIPVPGNTYEALPGYNGVAWYRRDFNIDAVPVPGRRSFLHFGAVQYFCRVWLNGRELGLHEGCETPFEFEITGKLVAGSNSLLLRVENPLGIFRNGKLPVFYDQGGIVGHVDLIEQPCLRISDVYAKPDSVSGAIAVEVTCDNAGSPAECVLQTTVAERKSHEVKDRNQLRIRVPSGTSVYHLTLKVAFPHTWDLDDPFLYTVTTRAASGGDADVNRIERMGFRDFRIVNGFFELNGRRIFLKGCHSNHLDPVIIQGVEGGMTWLGGDAAKLKAAGFNMFRSLSAALLPDQLAIADEVGLLMYSEHAGSWLLSDPTKFKVGLLDIFRRDRNSPSFVMFGLLNEIDSRSPGVYPVARDTLPLIRTVDDSRLIMLSSGRWDRDFASGSASNPGSSTWNVFLGGEGPKLAPIGSLPDMAKTDNPDIPPGGFIGGAAGDLHVYNTHPNSWRFIDALRTLAASTHPVFISESGCGSTFDPYTERRDLLAAKAPPEALAWGWTNQHIEELETMWKRYHLTEAYPEIPSMIVDSQRAAASERDLLTRAIRANPKICGYSLTSMTDAFGAAEGIWDNFRGWKAGHEEAVTAGWAHTRFCLFANPTPITSGKPIRLVAVLADEDRLAPGPHQVILRVRDAAGTEQWTTTRQIILGELGPRPLATTLFDGDLTALSLPEGSATIEAALDGAGDLPGSRLKVPVYDAARHPHIQGSLEVIGLDATARSLLAGRGAKLQDYDPAVESDHLTIVCGPQLPAGWNAQAWRGVYAKVARGAHLLIVGPDVLRGKSGPTHFLAIAQHGKREGKPDPSIYHREVIANPGPTFEGLPAKLLTGEVYGQLLLGVPEITGATPPETAVAVAFDGSGMGKLTDGLVIGTWRHGAGRITVCTMDVIAQLGAPVPDRLLINLVRNAQSSAAALQPLPVDYPAELDKMGIVE